MNIIDRISYHTWNIGFVERSVEDVVTSNDTELQVHWVKHNYKDRFFADPFILSVDKKEIRVLVEDFPYYDKVGMISLLVVNRKTYELKERKVVLKQPFHMSYPFIQRKENGEFWVAPEASISSNLHRYTMNPDTSMLENQEVLLAEPLLDSTIIEHDGKYWLFCTKRGQESNKSLFIYYSDKPEGPWTAHNRNPVVQNAAMARPAGYMVKVDGEIYRVIQKCDHHYGEAINVSKVDVLNESEYKETFIKELNTKDQSVWSFHTINGYGNLSVVDGVFIHFYPFRRLIYEICNKIMKSK